MDIEENTLRTNRDEPAPPFEGMAKEKSATHYDTLRDLIRADITSSFFKPGQRLVVGELIKRYNTSPQPVRDALNQLQGEGFILISPNRGASVRILDESFVRNIFEIRALLEPLLVERFCRYCTSAMIEELKGVQLDFEIAVRDENADIVESANSKFHDLIFRSDPNTEAIEVLERYADLLESFRRRLPSIPYRMRARIEEHRAILAAFEAGDPTVAADAARRHVRAAGDDFLEAMRQIKGNRLG
ncbi:GntR family transcriptional regulator [Rhizobium sp. BK376]|uniref:GntR family transcriptional regulator n=1 Tax=Rhizobium sp. BK376 TaxID=2512149 RepID=UPI001043684E|nr:GntR family transcriptional regulator [Rhizobium sp. BK376]TCR72650.1 GntR family transcriptional regulator [Rhizobium sp. BK376]